MPRNGWVPGWLAGLLLAVFAVPAHGLWVAVDEIDDRLESRSPAAVRAWVLQPTVLDPALWPDRASMALPDGTTFSVAFQDLAPHAVDGHSWMGTGPDRTQAVISLVGDTLAGLITTHDSLFEIRPDAEHGTLLLQLDPSAFPACDGGLEPTGHGHAALTDHETLGAQPPPPRPARDPARDAGTVVMDLLVLYTRAARQALGGVEQIESHALAAVANANAAFVNSQVDARFNVSGIVEIPYTETNNCSDDLGWVRASPVAQQLRDEFHADMVGMLTQVSYCGCGYVMRNPGPAFAPHAYQVTSTGCAVGNLTYAHEHGHNMGMEHDPANGPAPNVASYPWSFGHFSSGSFRTVMSYANQCSGSCPRRMHFSNPDVMFGGTPTGIDNQRDNARTAALTAPVVRQFRNPPADPPVIDVDPASITVHLQPGEQLERTLMVANTGGEELDWQVDQNAPGCDLPGWIQAAPDQGTIAPGAQESLQLPFDSGDLEPGSYSTSLCLASNDPQQPLLQVGLQLQVGEPVISVYGAVTSLGYCQDNPQPAATALVVADGQTQSYTTLSDADGHYQFELPEAQFPVTLSATATGHVTITLEPLELPSAPDATDFALPARLACADLEPEWLERLLVDDTVVENLVLDNSAGNDALQWNLVTDGACSDPETIPWLALGPAGGTVAPGKTRSIELTLTAGQLDPGDYLATLCLQTSDEFNDQVSADLVLRVRSAAILRDRFQIETTLETPAGQE